MSQRPHFFDDLDDPLISMELGRPRVVLPGPGYPGDRSWWHSGFDAYAKGWPPRNGGRPMEEADSWMHGYMTARMADLLGAVVPDPLPDVSGGPSPLRPMVVKGEDGTDVEETTDLSLGDLYEREPSVTAEALCPYEGEKGEAWREGYSGGVSMGAEHVQAWEQGVEARHVVEGGPLEVEDG